MLYLDLPLGQIFGWGICGKYLSRELALQTPVQLLREPKHLGQVDALEGRFLLDYCLPAAQMQAIQSGTLTRVEGPVLQASQYTFPSWSGQHWDPPMVRGTHTACYMFFDETRLDPGYSAFLNETYDQVIAGSEWCRQLLLQNGVEKTTAIIQGIDPVIFNPYLNQKTLFPDRFVIFSGGKFELRKGQDIVIRAFKVLQDRYPDVMLVAAWHNPWVGPMATMANSKLIQFSKPDQSQSFLDIMKVTLQQAGIDLSRVLMLPSYPNAQMAQIYKNTDVGLFTNRWEGGTNLVLMEYMACGKPVIASYHTGHRDILTDSNARCIYTLKEQPLKFNHQVMSTWYEADLEETIAHLDWAYHHRDDLKPLGQQAASDLSQYTWAYAASQFIEALRI